MPATAVRTPTPTQIPALSPAVLTTFRFKACLCKADASMERHVVLENLNVCVVSPRTWLSALKHKLCTEGHEAHIGMTAGSNSMTLQQRGARAKVSACGEEVAMVAWACAEGVSRRNVAGVA